MAHKNMPQSMNAARQAQPLPSLPTGVHNCALPTGVHNCVLATGVHNCVLPTVSKGADLLIVTPVSDAAYTGPSHTCNRTEAAADQHVRGNYEKGFVLAMTDFHAC